jgi:nicotinamide-nucleotide amidase
VSPLERRAAAFLAACERRGLMAATAESCTGGMIIAALTDIAGSSTVVERGFITYSNRSKIEMLGVSPETLYTHGAVSSQTALAMADGALAHSPAGIALAVTGIAGPGGGSLEKPVGLVWFGVALRGRATRSTMRIFEDRGRAFIRREAALHALEFGLAALDDAQAPSGGP